MPPGSPFSPNQSPGCLQGWPRWRLVGPSVAWLARVRACFGLAAYAAAAVLGTLLFVVTRAALRPDKREGLGECIGYLCLTMLWVSLLRTFVPPRRLKDGKYLRASTAAVQQLAERLQSSHAQRLPHLAAAIGARLLHTQNDAAAELAAAARVAHLFSP